MDTGLQRPRRCATWLCVGNCERRRNQSKVEKEQIPKPKSRGLSACCPRHQREEGGPRSGAGCWSQGWGWTWVAGCAASAPGPCARILDACLRGLLSGRGCGNHAVRAPAGSPLFPTQPPASEDQRARPLGAICLPGFWMYSFLGLLASSSQAAAPGLEAGPSFLVPGYRECGGGWESPRVLLGLGLRCSALASLLEKQERVREASGSPWEDCGLG